MQGPAPAAVYRALESRFPHALASARKLLRQPSVSATGEGVRECAEIVRRMMAEIGCKTRTWRKRGHPLVIGELDVGAPVTLVEYEMYDVQPVGDLDAWMSPPFAANIRTLPGVGKAIIARGSTNSKGALANHLFTWKTIQDVDEMPVNLKILAEGEEEISSANFIEFVRTHRPELKADAAIANDYTEDLRGVPTVYLGVKGCIYLTIWSRGNPKAVVPWRARSTARTRSGSPRRSGGSCRPCTHSSTGIRGPQSTESGTTSGHRRDGRSPW
ncbi:MAG: M20/M25/M40 family metallo-hydrolase [Thermoplasmata archaeon]